MEMLNPSQGPGESSTMDADVLLIGAGLSGLTAAFDLAEAGRRVLLVEGSGGHGGTLTLLDRQFPTDSCGFCQILPHTPREAEACLKSILDHSRIVFWPSTAVAGVDGSAGDFTVRLRRKATGVDMTRCTRCGRCIEACPETYPDPLHGGVITRKAIGYRAPVCAPSEIAVDWERCTRCGACVEICPEEAVNLDAQDREEMASVGAIVVATGFRLHDPSDRQEYGYGRFPDVITTLELERLLGKALLEGREEVRRPSDGGEPSRIAWIQCVGSRDEDHNYCSSVCCMISLKETRIIREMLPHAHLEMFYMDLRTCGKGYEAYLNEAKDMGVQFTRGRPGEVFLRDGQLLLQVEGPDGTWREEAFDLVILSVGFEPSDETRRLAGLLGIPLDQDGFLQPEPGSLSRTGRDGIYVAGAAAEPRDIPEAVMQAHESATLAASHSRPPAEEAVPVDTPVTDPMEEDLRVLVALCDCAGTLVSSLDWEALRAHLEAEPHVVEVRMNTHLCLEGGLRDLHRDLRESKVNALVVGACTPRWLHARLRAVLSQAGLDPNLVQIANLREQGAWAHGEAVAETTNRVEAELRAALARCREYRPFPRLSGTAPCPEVLVVGGGPAGISAALALSELGHGVTLVERAAELGGNLRWLHYGLDPKFRPQRLLEDLLNALRAASDIQVLTETSVQKLRGRPGAFQISLMGADGRNEERSFGAVVLATGARMHRPNVFHYGEDPRILTQRDLETALASHTLDPKALQEVAMIQCVGSRDAEHPYCSRICCAAALKNTLRLMTANPELRVLVFYRDIRAFGTLERYYGKAREQGAIFVSFEPTDPPVVEIRDGDLTLTAFDPVVGLRVRFRPDHVILNTGLVPEAPADLLNFLDLAPNFEGFLPEVNPKFRPLDLRDGVYACGLALGPSFLGEAMAQGRGAAIRASAFLEGLKRPAPYLGARVQASRCSACGLCVAACPFDARELDEELGYAVVHPELCQACGTCAGICPNDATQLVGGADRQVLSAIDALMEA